MNQLSKFLAALLLKLILLLLLLTGNSAEAQRRSTSVNVQDNGKTTVSVRNPFGSNFQVEYRGDIKLSDDDTDIVSISRGGYMEIKRSAFGSRRRIFIEPNDSGQLIKKYYVGGSQKSFDPEGKKWLAEILLEVVRTTTLGSEQRVNRIYKKRGTHGVLREVDIMESNHVKARYIKLLLKKDLKNADVISTLHAIGDGIDSDHHRADILKGNTSKFLNTEGSTTAFIYAASEINSDHHKAEVLKKSMRDGSIKGNQLKTLFIIARDIDSDHHKSSVLQTALKDHSLSSENLKVLTGTAKGIDSDHHRAEVLKAALNQENLPPSSVHTFISALDGVSSDYHRASVLLKSVGGDMDASTISHVLKAVSRMDSDSHQANVLKKLLQEHKLSSGNVDDLITALDRINSDSQKADVYKYVAKSSYPDSELIKLIKSTKSINSDYHMAVSLLRFSTAVKSAGSDVKEAYRQTCNSLSSDSHYRRAINGVQ
nr:hypothetical protein [Allomuricauda sp.]